MPQHHLRYLWASKLRDRSYRWYPGSTWILVAGPVVAALPIVALMELIMTKSSAL